MKKFTIALISLLALALGGCQNAAAADPRSETASGVQETGLQTAGASGGEESEALPENASDSGASQSPAEGAPGTAALETQPGGTAGTDVSQAGPYGTISVSLPAGWTYETCPIDSDNLIFGQYGIHFYPEDASDGYIELAYVELFGVCGTGLSEEKTTVAGNSAYIGTYDNHEYWDFISFDGDLSNIIAQTFSVSSWWNAYGDQALDILNTVSFDPNAREGGAYIYSSESDAEKIGLSLSLKQITPTGATLIFHQYDDEAPDGELTYGDDFLLEQKNNSSWESVPVIINGDYAFNAVAHIIPAGDSSEIKLSWEWLYGKLAPGEYRICKRVLDSRGPGDNDSYTLYANFILN